MKIHNLIQIKADQLENNSQASLLVAELVTCANDLIRKSLVVNSSKNGEYE